MRRRQRWVRLQTAPCSCALAVSPVACRPGQAPGAAGAAAAAAWGCPCGSGVAATAAGRPQRRLRLPGARGYRAFLGRCLGGSGAWAGTRGMACRPPRGADTWLGTDHPCGTPTGSFQWSTARWPQQLRVKVLGRGHHRRRWYSCRCLRNDTCRTCDTVAALGQQCC